MLVLSCSSPAECRPSHLIAFDQQMRVVRRLFLGLATAMAALALALLSLAIVATIKFYSDRDPALSASPLATSSDAHPRLAAAERKSIAAEHPAYFSRGKEQTYLTLAEWYQVYSYNEFGNFLASGGRQTDFPFATAIGNFWSCYFLSLEKSKGQEFNWQYNFVSWVIGINLTVEYGVKFAYENTVGRITQAIAGSDTEADGFIAKSWNSYAKTLYQTTWYHYPYFADLPGIWRETALFNGAFVRNAERKIAFSVSYLLKGSYAQLWLLGAEQKDNQTFSVVQSANRALLNDDGIKVLKELSGNRFLIETERYAGFKAALVKLIERNVSFIEIMGHETIALAYLSKNAEEPISASARVIDRRELFYHPEGYRHRITLEARVDALKDTLRLIADNGSKFEMIYDF
ncbi:hypothetical protein [Bradyrhizobium paxllaeri]|uniref:hypothetical protein n=1 Tax=Bradyrhizobium paxllaeri TaxID=190148 RepID=UPI0011DF811D|nr:hypothetical protein [Bradyrhizobium paxllaeri]